MSLLITITLLAFMLVMIVLFSRHSARCDQRTRQIHRLRDFARFNPRFLQ